MLAHGWVGSECTKGLSEGAISRINSFILR